MHPAFSEVWFACRVLQISVTWSLLQKPTRCSFANATFRSESGTGARPSVSWFDYRKGSGQCGRFEKRSNSVSVGGKASGLHDVRNGSTRLLSKEGVSLKKKGSPIIPQTVSLDGRKAKECWLTRLGSKGHRHQQGRSSNAFPKEGISGRYLCRVFTKYGGWPILVSGVVNSAGSLK